MPKNFDDLVTRTKIWRKLALGLVVMVIICAALFAMVTDGGDDRVKPVVEIDVQGPMIRNSLEPQNFPFVPEEGNFRQNDEQVIFHDRLPVHHCDCNPGWCVSERVSPSQRAHPRPAQPSD